MAGHDFEIRALETGQVLLGNLPDGEDILKALCRILRDQGGTLAWARVSGGLEKAVLGVFDFKQKVYATRLCEGSLDIASCQGIVALGEENRVNMRVVVADQEGQCAGGRLFSPAIGHGADFVMARLEGENLSRGFDPLTGRDQWLFT